MFKPGCREGFIDSEIGMYDFLDPTDPTIDPKTWSKDTLTKFAAAFNKNHPEMSSRPLQAEQVPDMFKFPASPPSEAEAKYFGENGIYPYCGYVKKYLADHPEKIPAGQPINGSLKELQKNMTNRMAYAFSVRPDEMNNSPPTTAYQIFSGKMKAPNNPALTAKSTSSSSSSSDKLSATDYKSLQTICKNVNTS